jgi:hypothetical protein
MKYPFMLLLGMVMLSALVFMMLMRALLTGLEIFLERKRKPEVEPELELAD